MVLIHSKYIWHYYNPDTGGAAFLVSALTQAQWPAVSLTTPSLNTQLQTSLTSTQGSSSWKKMIKWMIKYRGYLLLSHRTLTLTRESLEVQDECFLGFVKTGLGVDSSSLTLWGWVSALKVVCDWQWSLIVEICRIVNRNCVQGQWTMAPVMTWTPLLSRLWGLSAWLAPENGEQCD